MLRDQTASIHIKSFRFNYAAAAVAAFIFFSFINLAVVMINHYCFRTFAFDYAAYNFAFFDFAHFRVSPDTVYTYNFPMTFLQDHFSLMLILLSPLYWLLGWLFGTYTLLIIQWMIIISGGWATYKLIILKSKDYKLSLGALVYYFVLFGRYSSYAEDCNLAIMGSAMIPVFLLAFEKKNVLAIVAGFLFLIVAREDYPILLLFLFAFLMIVHRKDRFKFRCALILFLVSAVFLVLVFKVFIPALEDANKKYTFFEFHAIGSTPREALLFVLRHPLKAIKLLFINHSGSSYYDWVKPEFYIVYLLSGGILLFLRPLYLLPFLPLIAKKMYTDAPFRWSIESYYSVEFVSLMPVMVFSILAKIERPKLKYIVVMITCIITLGVTIAEFFIPTRKMTCDNSKYNFLTASFYKLPYDRKALMTAIDGFSQADGISATSRLAPHLALRERIYYYPRVDDSDYIFLLKHDDDYPLSAENFQKEIYTLLHDADWTVVQNTTDFIIFFRPKRK